MATDKNGENKISFKDSMQMCSVAGKLLPKYILSFTGMIDGNGVPITLDQFNKLVAVEFYFVPLVGEIIGKLIEISTVSEEEEGNLEEPLEGNPTAFAVGLK